MTEADAEQTARKCKTPSTPRDSLPLHASYNSQWFLHESMIVSDESDANTCGVSKHLLNRDRETVSAADAGQTAMQRTQSRIAVEGGTETTLA